MNDKLIRQLSELSDTRTRFSVTKSESFGFSVIGDKLTDIKERNKSKLGIDLIKNEKRMRKKIDVKDLSFVKNNIKELYSLCSYKDQKFYPEFSDVIATSNELVVDDEISKLSRENLSDFIPQVVEMNKIVLKLKEVKAIDSKLGFSHSKVCKIHKDGIIEDVELGFSLGCSVSVKDRTESTTELYKDFFTFEDFDIESFKDELFVKIKDMTNPEFDDSINFKDYDLIFPQESLSGLVSELMISQLSLERYTKKDSYIWQDVEFDKKITIEEDPFIDYSFYSSLYDSDLILTEKKKIIDKGKIDNYLSDLDLAYKYKGKSTGNASGVTNVIMKPGKESKEDLIGTTKKGLIIQNILGLHTTNSREGSLNITAESAIEIIGGKKKRVLKNVPINVKFADLLRNVDVSKENTWCEHYNLPTLFCRK